MEFKTCGKSIDAVLERVLAVNIANSDYLKELFRVKTYEEVVDEIYNHVDNVEPWMTGNMRGPSTAFCLLYKLSTFNLDGRQVTDLIEHVDSVYIRAIGFLYIRYLADPKTIWEWFEPYIQDSEEIAPGTNGKKSTLGAFNRDILLGQYYFDSLLPRIPVLVMRQITTGLEESGLPSQPSGLVASANRHGADEGMRRPPSVKAALSVSFGQRAPHRSSTRGSSPARRGVPAATERSPIRNGGTVRLRESDRSGKRDRITENGSRDRERGLERDDRGRDDDRQEKERRRSEDREYSRRDRESGRDRDRDRDDRGGRDRDIERREERDWEWGGHSSKSGDRDRSHRSRDKEEGSRDRHRHRDRHGGRERERDRSRDRSYRSRSPATKENSLPAANLQKLKDLYGDASKGESLKGRGSDREEKDSSKEEVIRLGGSKWR